MKYCNKCGAESPDMGTYCIECGERLEHKKEYQVIQTTGSMVGRVNSLIVVRDPTRGIRCQVVPIEVQVFPTQGVGGRIIATGRLRVLTRESIQNVAILIRKLTGINLSKMDVHIQFLGVHGVEWDHFVLAIACAIMSDLKQLPIRQDLAMMGSLSVSGEVLPVRNVTTMIEEASTVGIKDIIIPAANIENISLDEDVREKLNIIPVKILEEALKIAMDSHSSNHHVFCPFRIQKQDSKAGCVLKLGKETLCYTQDLYPLLFDDGRYYCPELQFKLSAAIYKETETYINSILNIYDEGNIARNLWAIISDQKNKEKITKLGADLGIPDLGNSLYRKKDIKISVVGLNGAGKTTMLQRLKTGRWIPDTTPSIGMNAETIQIGDVTFSGWGIGGQLQFRRTLWEMYTKNSAGLIYVVDVSDPARFPEARNNLWRMLKMDHLKDIPIAIFANQEDINDDGQAITEEELAKTLGINQKIDQSIKIFYTNTKTGIGIQEGIDWLINIIQKRPKSPGN